EAALTLDEVRGLSGRQCVESLEIDGAADPHEGGRPARVQPELAEASGRQPCERCARRGRVQIRSFDKRSRLADDAQLELPGPPRVDQLAAERTQECLRNGRQPELAHPLEPKRRLPDQRISSEFTEELGVVGVDGEDEPKPLESVLALRSQYNASVHRLPRGSHFDAVTDAQRSREGPVAKPACGVA